MEDIEYLRQLVGESLEEGYDEDDSLFSNAELENFLLRSSNFFYLAAADIWSVKAGRYADQIDQEETGSSRKLSQLYRQAKDQANYYMKLAGDIGQVSGVDYYPAIRAKVASLREEPIIDPKTVNVVWPT